MQPRPTVGPGQPEQVPPAQMTQMTQMTQRHPPSGLFPSGRLRPSFREPNPIRLGSLFAGAAIAASWLFAFGLLSTSAGAYIWLTLVASIVAWAVACVLALMGDRGAAVGVALSTALGVAIAVAVLIQRWATVGWPLW